MWVCAGELDVCVCVYFYTLCMCLFICIYEHDHIYVYLSLYIHACLYIYVRNFLKLSVRLSEITLVRSPSPPGPKKSPENRDP